MRKRFILIFITVILITIPFNTINATSTPPLTQYEDKKTIPHFKYWPSPNKYFNHSRCLHGFSANLIEKNSVFNLLKKIIELADKIILAIIFLFWVVITLIRAFHNRTIKKKYGRDNNKYEAKRNEDEGDERERHSIFLVSKEKNSEGKLVYHHIINLYSLAKLGYTRPSRKNDCFSAKNEDYVMEENIIFYNITFDFRKIDS
jgi:hypothetical protein